MFKIVPLAGLVGTLSDEEILGWLRSYSSVFDSKTETYLHNKALEMEKRQLSRTFLTTDDDKNILGYISIGIKCINVPPEMDIDEKILHKMNIEPKRNVAQSYLLGQLSRSTKATKGFGRTLVDIAIKKVREANERVGCRTIRLDCHDELEPYYEKLGFEHIMKNETESLNQMVTFI